MSLRFTVHAARLAGVALALAGALVIEGCDNPACVFGGDCSSSSGSTAGPGLGSVAATLPPEGAWVDPARPVVRSVLPGSQSADPDTPIVIVFSESMVESSLIAPFELVPELGGQQIGLSRSALIGDGRVLVLRPAATLELGRFYEVRHRAGAEPIDYNGQSLAVPTSGVAGSFRVAAAAPAAPAVLTTYPADNAVFQSEQPEIVVIFTRRLNPATVDGDSFDIQVEGSDPTFDPAPIPVTVIDLFPTQDTRIWTWQSVDAASLPVALGRDSTVSISLSPNGDRLADAGGALVPSTVVDFETAPFGIVDVALTSSPSDAINIANLTDLPAGPNPLELTVDLLDVLATDVLDVQLFGFDPNPPDPMQPPELFSIVREVPVGVAGAMVSMTLDASDLNLLASTSPLAGRMADGPLGIYVRLRRSTAATQVVGFDADPATLDLDLPIFDTTRPVVLGLGVTGMDLTGLVSDQPDVAIMARASEPLRAAFVTTGLGDNGPDPTDPPEVVGSTGLLFVAAPLRLPATNGIVPPASNPLPFTLSVYDRALNAALVPTMGVYRQVGAGGTGTPLGATLTVDVFDATSLDPIADAVVLTHVDAAGVVTLLDEDLTLADGTQMLGSALLPGEELLLTVDAPGYDIFTLHGVASDRVSVPLERVGGASGMIIGTIHSEDPFGSQNRAISDSRFDSLGAKLVAVDPCLFDPFTLEYDCPFGPLAVSASKVGAQSFLATSMPTNEGQYSAAAFLIAFDFLLPVAAVDPSGTGTTALAVPFLLNDLTTPFEETAIDAAARTLDTSAYPMPGSTPVVTIEALAPGVAGAVVVGRGVAFSAGVDTWTVRSAYPGAVDPFDSGGGDTLGRLVLSGTLEPDLFLRAQVLNASGLGIARPRLSAGVTPLVPPAASTLIAPVPAGSSGGISYDVVCSDVLSDIGGGPRGLYRVTLTSAVTGRRWQLWRPDPSDAAASDVIVRVPTMGVLGTPLANGTIRCTIEAFAWPTLDLATFMWAEVPREVALQSLSVQVEFTQP